MTTYREIPSQAFIIAKWNAFLARRAERYASLTPEERASLPFDMPPLKSTGTCYGLTYAHQYYYQQGASEEFFGLLNAVVALPNEELEKHIDNNTPLGNKLTKLFSAVSRVQEKWEQKQSIPSAKSIGANVLKQNHQAVSNLDDIKSIFDDFKQSKAQGITLAMPGHIISIYKKEGSFIAYDSNADVELKTTDVDTLAKFTLFRIIENERLLSSQAKQKDLTYTERAYRTLSSVFSTITNLLPTNLSLTGLLALAGGKLAQPTIIDTEYLANPETEIKSSYSQITQTLQSQPPDKHQSDAPVSDLEKSLFMHAVRHDDVDFLKDFISEHPQFNLNEPLPYQPETAISDSVSPLELALIYGLHETAKCLLDAGADPNQSMSPNILKDYENFDGLSPLHFYAYFNDTAALEVLLKSEKIDVDRKENSARGGTALHMALAHGNYEAAKLLLEHGANPKLDPPFDSLVDQEKNPRMYDLLQQYRKEPKEEEPVETPRSTLH